MHFKMFSTSTQISICMQKILCLTFCILHHDGTVLQKRHQQVGRVTGLFQKSFVNFMQFYARHSQKHTINQTIYKASNMYHFLVLQYLIFYVVLWYINVFQSQHLMNGIALFLPGAGSLRGLDTGTVGEEGGVVGVDGV